MPSGTVVQKGRSALGALGAALIAVCIGCAHADTARFSGVVTAIDCGCWSDGICKIFVGDREIVFGQGWSGATWGTVDGLVGCEASIGMHAEVYARRYDGSVLKVRDWYTLEGSGRYYVSLDRPSADRADAGRDAPPSHPPPER
jgi:hypothetical protein